MGYQTKYTLTTEPKHHRAAVAAAVIEEIGYLPFEDQCKWYDHETDMVRVSQRFSATIITLHGIGEEPDDEWVRHYHRGQSVHHGRTKWQPPAPPAEWIAQAETVIEPDSTVRARELAELERLQTKYKGGA